MFQILKEDKMEEGDNKREKGMRGRGKKGTGDKGTGIKGKRE